ncbi:MAG: endonuclease III domain-containing protein [Acidobacteriota bacterium]
MRSRSAWVHLPYYRALLRAYGPQGWWPARTRFEVVVGAILTQNVSWTNVEKALAALRREGLLSPDRMRRAPLRRIARLIRPAAYFNQKARGLRAFLEMVERDSGGRLGRLLALPAPELRERLLAVSGIGPETADSILLYAAARPVFVADAYSRRLFARHAVLDAEEGYEEARRLLGSGLPADPVLLGEYHALLVRVGKERCLRREPRCRGCPLETLLPSGGPRPLRCARRPSRRTRRAGRGRHRAD